MQRPLRFIPKKVVQIFLGISGPLPIMLVWGVSRQEAGGVVDSWSRSLVSTNAEYQSVPGDKGEKSLRSFMGMMRYVPKYSRRSPFCKILSSYFTVSCLLISRRFGMLFNESRMNYNVFELLSQPNFHADMKQRVSRIPWSDDLSARKCMTIYVKVMPRFEEDNYIGPPV